MSMISLHHHVPLAPAGWTAEAACSESAVWASLAPLPPLLLADGSGPAAQQTTVRLCCDQCGLYVRFDCSDRDIWGTYDQRDAPIYDEEVVELFLSPGRDVPRRYVEIEVSPNGVMFDARIDSPAGTRVGLTVDTGWDCPGITWRAERHDADQRWSAVLCIPFAALVEGEPPEVWRANFYRIERPREGMPEFSCWSPTYTEPADFHVAGRFGTLYLPRR
ncbi:MAG: hypothetical protein RLZZ387_4839 [Chloroflexota bacterium]|jgi:hypothetical protein